MSDTSKPEQDLEGLPSRLDKKLDELVFKHEDHDHAAFCCLRDESVRAELVRLVQAEVAASLEDFAEYAHSHYKGEYQIVEDEYSTDPAVYEYRYDAEVVHMVQPYLKEKEATDATTT